VTERVALVTGCSTGIGHASALALHEAGLATYATARRPETLADLEAAGCRTLPLDVTDEAARVQVVRAIDEERGGVDVLVNNAGYADYGAVEEISLERWRREFETNLFGAVRLTQLVLPGMRERGHGRIINMSSMGGRMALPLGGAYHGSSVLAGVASGYGGRRATTSEHVATVVVKAATARRPRTRYPVTLYARLLMTGRALLPDRMWDAVLRRTFRS
jgi:NADP-dependent 3-hydroxy acid dehydrogenase YdfG